MASDAVSTRQPRRCEIFLWVASLYAYAMIAILNDAPEPVAAAAMQVYRADMALIGMTTVAEARSRLRACGVVPQRVTDVCDDIVIRNPRAFA